jgi:FkbM family methyltransferase
MASLRVLAHAFRAWRRNRKWAKHEPETPYLADLLSGAPICLHVGASDGRHSYVMTQVAPEARIFAFEPSAFTYQVLKTCIAWHGISDRVTPVHAGVWDRSGDMLLVTPKKTSGRMGRSFAYIAEAPPSRGLARPDIEDMGARLQPAPVVALDDFCAREGLEKIDFIRMDIEGAEQKALWGARAILDRDRPHVLLEIHPAMLHAQFGGSADQVLGFFRERGYRMFVVEEDRLEERDQLDTSLPWRSYFFVHPARAKRLPDGVFKARMAA